MDSADPIRAKDLTESDELMKMEFITDVSPPTLVIPVMEMVEPTRNIFLIDKELPITKKSYTEADWLGFCPLMRIEEYGRIDRLLPRLTKFKTDISEPMRR
jgi:hypothetical protein